jgi:Flp pilus assembly protein TadG
METRSANLSGLIGRLAVRWRMPRIVRRFRHNVDGVTAVEFGLIAFPFFALMMAIVETALALFAQGVLDDAVATTARLIRTGQAQQQGLNQTTFKDALCARLTAIFSCQSGVVVDVQSVSGFGSFDTSVPRDSGGNLKKTDNNFNWGNSSSIVMVRAFYEWPVFVNRLGTNLKTEPNGTHLLTATALFRNEPFPW